MSLSQYDYIYPNQGTFAGFTLETRFPKILNDILDNPKLEENSKTALAELRDQLDTVKVEQLELPECEVVFWKSFFQEYVGLPYREVPFFFLEIYFYRLINQIINSHQESVDPFAHIKWKDLESNSEFFNQVASQHPNLSVSECIHLAVEGNQADLSQISGSAKGNPLTYLIDDSEQLANHLSDKGIHIIADNAGVELFTDLVLISTLIKTDQQVTLHLKHLPLLVSDATPSDFDILLEHLEKIGLHAFVSEIKKLLVTKKLIIHSHPFWNAPKFYNQLPQDECSGELLISKGDANYRRFFHDKNFPPHLSFELNNISFDQVFAFRTLKSDIQTGLSIEQVEKLNSANPDWMHCGQYAVIQQLK